MEKDPSTFYEILDGFLQGGTDQNNTTTLKLLQTLMDMISNGKLTARVEKGNLIYVPIIRVSLKSHKHQINYLMTHPCYFPSAKERADSNRESIWPHKLGYSNDVLTRMGQLKTSHHGDPKLALIITCEDNAAMEKALKDELQAFKSEAGGTEMFNTNRDQVKNFL